MNTLQNLCGTLKIILAALLITGSFFAFSAQAQMVSATVAPQEQGKMYGDPGFRGEPINLNVVNADIREILNYITEQYGINFVIDKSVKSVPVTVNITNVPWNVALDSILRSQGLGVQVSGNILRIAEQLTLADEQSVRQKIEASRLDDSPLYTEFIRLNYARASGTLASAGGGPSQPTAGVSTSGSGTGSSGGSSDSGGGVGSSASGGNDQGILGIIKRRLSRRGGIEVDGRSNTLIVTDVRENIAAIRQLVLLLDQPEPQVEIESRVVIATRNFSRDLGVRLSGLVVGTRGQGGNFSTLNQASSFNTVIGLTTGVFGTAQINAEITAGETNGQAKTIATPRVTTLNNRKATIESGQKIPVTTVQPGSGSGGTLIATTTYIDVPLKLEVTPQITDVGTVILNVLVENSSTAPTVAGVAPAISTQNMQTEVMVPDGGTTVVGGVISDDERKSQDRTPGLASIPLLGNLFKRNGTARNTNEILFFITPRIYRPDFAGNPGAGTVGSGTKTTTIIQPVPLGNPPSNSETQTQTPQTPVNNPLAPAMQTITTVPPPVIKP